MTTQTAPYALGFTTLDREVTLDALPVEGEIPDWLTGVLLRTAPTKFEVGGQSYNHWFDGLAMLHRFGFEAGRVSYRNRFVRSKAYTEAMDQDRIVRAEFMTDPCRTLFGRVMSLFDPKTTDNPCVNLSRLGGESVALTETPIPIRFDPDTLDTLGPLTYDKVVSGQVSTAHPHHDGRRGYSYMIAMGRKSHYRIFTDADGKQRVLAEIETNLPAYMHSFGMSERFLVLAEFALRVNPLRLRFSGVSGEPFIRNYRWEPERGTLFTVIDKATGAVVAEAEGAPCFAFHHVNAHEADGVLHVDLLAYPDADIIERLRLARLRSAEPIDAVARLTRYSVPLDGKSNREAASEVLCDAPIELPRIDYARRAGRQVRVVWGAGLSRAGDFIDNVTRIALPDRPGTEPDVAVWHTPGCYPGEPVFVARPDGEAEDDGVLLSVVLDATANHSFLLVLDAATLEERARATVPHHVPFGFHGNYFGGREKVHR